MTAIICITLLLILILVVAGLTSLAIYWRYTYDRKIVSRHIAEQGGTVEQFRLHMRPIRGEYEVTYRDRNGNRQTGRCRTCVSGIYWAANKQPDNPQQPK